MSIRPVGMEFEIAGHSGKRLDNEEKSAQKRVGLKFDVGYDSSILYETGFTAEYGTPPMEDVRKDLKFLFNKFKEMGVRANSTCGIHVHVDVSDFDEKSFGRLIELFFYIQGVLFGMNEYPREDNSYCRPLRHTDKIGLPLYLQMWAKEGLPLMKIISNLRRIYPRYKALNILSYRKHGTVEFRLWDHTLDYQESVVRALLCRAIVDTAYSSTSTNYDLYPSDLVEKIWVGINDVSEEEDKCFYKLLRRSYYQSTEFLVYTPHLPADVVINLIEACKEFDLGDKVNIPMEIETLCKEGLHLGREYDFGRYLSEKVWIASCFDSFPSIRDSEIFDFYIRSLVNSDIKVLKMILLKGDKTSTRACNVPGLQDNLVDTALYRNEEVRAVAVSLIKYLYEKGIEPSSVAKEQICNSDHSCSELVDFIYPEFLSEWLEARHKKENPLQYMSKMEKVNHLKQKIGRIAEGSNFVPSGAIKLQFKTLFSQEEFDDIWTLNVIELLEKAALKEGGRISTIVIECLLPYRNRIKSSQVSREEMPF